MGIDTEFHCDHGSFSRVTRMLDWRPFHYMTNISVQTFHKIPFKAPPIQSMYEFQPVDAGYTKLIFRMRSIRRDWFTMLPIRLFLKRMLDKENNADFDRLDKILAAMQEAD